MKKYLSKSDIVIIIITFILFSFALFLKGLTHDMLLEAGVLLVSIKIIIMNYKNSKSSELIIEDLKKIKSSIEKLEESDNLKSMK
ncbi:MAG: hypothetical protein JXR60_03135 [Bacteroidales bacterium]|nr:hypothetical protein [Bacteroidales bacterium]